MSQEFDNIRSIDSPQEGLHPNLEKIVKKHLSSKWLKPYAKHSLVAYTEIKDECEADGRPIIFDTGCGVGISTLNLAIQNPNDLILGIDKSQDRLDKFISHKAYLEKKHNTTIDNALVFRADLEDMFRMMLENDWKFKKIYFLYPNPWPKSEHFRRRWHGHPVFKDICQLYQNSEEGFELRTNWETYAQEFAEAIKNAGLGKTDFSKITNSITNENAITPFELKYYSSNQDLFKVII